MRQIEIEMNNAVRNKIAWSKGNSCTTFSSDLKECFIYLHGNHIATYNYSLKELSLYDGGWQSNTTKSRLNALLFEFATGFQYFKKTGIGTFPTFKIILKIFVMGLQLTKI